MDTLVQEYSVAMNSFKFEHHLSSIVPLPQQNHIRSFRMSHDCKDSPESMNLSSPVAQSSSQGNESEENDPSEVAILKYIGQMLMDEEEDLEHKPCMFYDCMALQATEKFFSDALIDSQTNQVGNLRSPDEGLSDVSSRISVPGPGEPFQFNDALESSLPSLGDSQQIQGLFGDIPNDNVFVFDLDINETRLHVGSGAEGGVKNHSPNDSSRKKHLLQDVNSTEATRSNKLLASTESDSHPLDMYDEVFSCSSSPCGESLLDCSPSNGTLHKGEQSKASRRRRPRAGKKQGIVKEVVDLRNLLMQCAQAVASFDTRTADELLKRIRQHSSPSGDATERLAYFFANALEARMAGTGTALYTSFDLEKYPAAEVVKAYQVYITASPFKRMSHIYANKSIKKVAGSTKSLHIIDFGILYGFQWPCLIQGLSEMPGGPPKLRMTGIDFPQRGFRPAARVEETGRRLEKYCKKFNVPFEYIAIAKKWETIKPEDLGIESGEVLAVNCLYRLENVPDETVVSSSPRDAVLNLIKRIKPDIFVHGVANGTYNSPFFATRFREALFHFSSLYDMFDATLERDNPQRMLFEKEVIGRDAMNAIACEGTERVERPETYKQWQVRNVRAGFKQLPLDLEILNFVKDKVNNSYHKDFIVDEDGNWMLQGWKGKVIQSLSCWKPKKKATII